MIGLFRVSQFREFQFEPEVDAVLMWWFPFQSAPQESEVTPSGVAIQTDASPIYPYQPYKVLPLCVYESTCPVFKLRYLIDDFAQDKQMQFV